MGERLSFQPARREGQMKTRWFANVRWSVIVVLALTSGVVLAQPAPEGKGPAATEAPAEVAQRPIGAWIDIWHDSIDNHNPAVAYNSRHGEYLVVWEDDNGATVDVHARRISQTGRVLNDFIVAHNANKMNWLPDVAYSSKQDEYLVVYTYNLSTTDYDIWGRAVKWDGSSMSLEFLINGDAGKQWYPAVAYNRKNDEYLVVYENYWSDAMRDIAAQRIRASGRTLLSWRNIASDANKIRRLPDVAYNATRNEYLIAYTYQSVPLGDSDIRAKITNANMSTLSTEIDITVPGSPVQDGVALAAGPNEYLAVWGEDYGASKASIWARRVGGTGTLNAFMALANDTGKRRVEPAVGFGDGGRYLVTWRGYTDAITEWDLYARTVLMGHNAPEDVAFGVDLTSAWQRSPAVACGPLAPCVVAYEDNWPSAGDYDLSGFPIGTYRTLVPLVLRRR
jgi:uncharacterized protein YlbG (UPF0298 family)